MGWRETLKTFLLAILLGTIFAVWFLGWATTGHCKEKEYFAVSPRIAIWGYKPVEVFARVVFTDAKEVACLGYVVGWGDGDVSAHEADCEGDVPPIVMYSARHKFRHPGTFTVTFILFRRNAEGKPKVFRKFQQEVEIR